jgi:V/A-type H+-transporting ATPase subunit F
MVGIAVIGNCNFVLGFRLAGIRETYIEDDRNRLEEKLNGLMKSGKTSILVLQDIDFNRLTPGMKKNLSQSVEPVVITIGKLDEENIREKIKKAIGVDLYKKEK